MAAFALLVWTIAVAVAAPELHRVETADGASIVLERHPRPGAAAVVLCHGISSNRRFWDLAPDRSLAVWLHDEGYDVWNLDLRGHGDAVVDGDGRRQRAGWSIDDYGRYDLPAAFDHVRQATGQGRLHYVGHSMGGMVLAVYLATHDDPPLASAVAVGSPLDFRDPDRVTRLLLGVGPAGAVPAFLPTPMGARLLARLDTRAPMHADEWLYNPDNIAADARRAMLRAIVSPLSRGEIRQLARMRRDGEFRSADGAIVWRERLADVDVPMLFFAGRLDRIVNPDRVRAYYDAVGSTDKVFVVASRANGFRGDYGHLDLGLGDHAEEDVFTRVAGWLRAHP